VLGNSCVETAPWKDFTEERLCTLSILAINGMRLIIFNLAKYLRYVIIRLNVLLISVGHNIKIETPILKACYRMGAMYVRYLALICMTLFTAKLVTEFMFHLTRPNTNAI
jgi:hypothetical protein